MGTPTVGQFLSTQALTIQKKRRNVIYLFPPRIISFSSAVTQVTWSRDDALLLTCAYDDDRTARIWEPRTGICQYSLTHHRQAVTAVAFASDGRIATGSTDQVQDI